MRTTPRDENTHRDTQAAMSPAVIDLRPGRRRRAGTLAFFGAIGIVAWLVAANAGDGVSDPSQPGASGALAPGRSTLEPGTYRLPGLGSSVSVTLPEGWFAGDSIWGPAGRGLAAVSTGRPGASTSLAVFDLRHLRPFEASSNRPLGRPGDLAWFERSLDDYRSRVEPRVRDRVLGRTLDWRPPPVLAWLLTHTDRRPVEVGIDVMISGRLGDLVSFTFPGPTSRLLDAPGPSSIALRPGVTYTFWVPTGRGEDGLTVMVGIARELGAVVGIAEADVIRTLTLGP